LSTISEREFLDKKAYFIEGNVFYYFCSSVPDVLDPPNQNITRIINYLGSVRVKEDNDSFYINCYNQVDIKMSILKYPL
jgi:hypothetical protein